LYQSLMFSSPSAPGVLRPSQLWNTSAPGVFWTAFLYNSEGTCDGSQLSLMRWCFDMGDRVLPDFPGFKQKLQQRLLVRFDQKRTSELGAFGETPAFSLQEGKRLILTNTDGVERETEFKHAGAEIRVSVEDLATLTLDQLVAKFEQAGTEIAKQQHEHAMNELTKAVDSVGNRLDARGETLATEHILRMLELISIDFNEAGQPRLPTMVVHPDQARGATEAAERIQTEPALRERFERMISQKREEWRVRESRRKLVG
jgi:hypothetical protein